MVTVGRERYREEKQTLETEERKCRSKKEKNVLVKRRENKRYPSLQSYCSFPFINSILQRHFLILLCSHLFLLGSMPSFLPFEPEATPALCNYIEAYKVLPLTPCLTLDKSLNPFYPSRQKLTTISNRCRMEVTHLLMKCPTLVSIGNSLLDLSGLFLYDSLSPLCLCEGHHLV